MILLRQPYETSYVTIHTYIHTYKHTYVCVCAYFTLRTAQYDEICMEKGKHFSTEKIIKKISTRIQNRWPFNKEDFQAKKIKLTFAKTRVQILDPHF